MMTQDAVIRAWKDPEYRVALSPAEQLTLPQHPAGLVELSEAELIEVEGGTGWECVAISISVVYVAVVVYDILTR